MNWKRMLAIRRRVRGHWVELYRVFSSSPKWLIELDKTGKETGGFYLHLFGFGLFVARYS